MAFAKSTHIKPIQVTFQVLQIPTPLMANNQAFLVYEIYLTNLGSYPVKLNSLEIISDSNEEKPLFIFSADKLRQIIKGFSGLNSPKAMLLNIMPGEQKILFMWLSFASATDIPTKLFHVLYFQTLNKEYQLIPIKSAPLILKKSQPIIIASPVKGDMWVAGNAPSNTSPHRRAGIVLDGHEYFSQRYAIDFVQIGPDGKTYHGDMLNNVNYYCYGKPVLAVANGKVLSITDNIPENMPNSGKYVVPINLQTAGGNEVILDLGNGLYALYGHLIPGTIQVKAGDVIKKGDVLGKIGNSGNSTEAHLHFQIMDKPSTLAANGVPYAFDGYELYPSEVTGIDATYKIKLLSKKTRKFINQLMLEDAVVKFKG